MGSMQDKTFSRIQKKHLNDKLSRLTTNTYFPHIPLAELQQIFLEMGLDISVLQGIFTGHEGRMHERIGQSELWFTMTWFRMGSGKFEIVCYVS
jgi:hypothetical protein